MHEPERLRATAAATSIAASLGLEVEDAVALNVSNKLTLRLLPCDVVARVAPAAQQVARLEVDLAERLVALGAPVAALDPRAGRRVHEHDGFVVTFWTSLATDGSAVQEPGEYADALARLHAAMRDVDLPVPHATDRVDAALRLVQDRERTPALADADRELLARTLRRLRGSLVGTGVVEQLLHGEPHPGNFVATADGLVAIDLETCCRGPVELDLAHAPDDVADHYPGVDRRLLADCRTLVLAMITAWRWDRDDRLPDGRRLAVEWLDRLRTETAGTETAGTEAAGTEAAGTEAAVEAEVTPRRTSPGAAR